MPGAECLRQPIPGGDAGKGGRGGLGGTGGDGGSGGDVWLIGTQEMLISTRRMIISNGGGNVGSPGKGGTGGNPGIPGEPPRHVALCGSAPGGRPSTKGDSLGTGADGINKGENGKIRLVEVVTVTDLISE